MKKPVVMTLVLSSIIVLISSLMFYGSPATTIPRTLAPMQSCSCSADDGSCSVSLECQGGCEKSCSNDNNCWAYCSGFFESLGTETTFEMQNGTYGKLVAELARLSGKNIAFSPAKQLPPFVLGFKQAALWDALEFLSDRGTVQIDGKDFESLRALRKSLLSGDRISLGVQNTPVSTFVNDMAGISGLPLRVAAGRPMSVVNVDIQAATLTEILAKVSEQTGTKIVEGSVEPNVPQAP